MITINHSLQFVTELDETNPIAIRLLSLEKDMQVQFLEGLLKDLVAPMLQPTLDEINAGNSWALLKVAN